MAACMAFVGVLAAMKSLHLGIGQLRNPGPGFLPLLSSFSFTVSAVFVLLTDRIEPERLRTLCSVRQFCLASALLGAVFTLKIMGFRLTTFLLLAVFLRIFGFRRWGVILGVSAAITLGSDLLFSRLLGLSLPKSPWGI